MLLSILETQGSANATCPTWLCAVQVGPEDHVICALSGGVDSTVAATLVHQVLGDRLHCVFVDNGLLRYKVSLCLLHDWARFLNVERQIPCMHESAALTAC